MSEDLGSPPFDPAVSIPLGLTFFERPTAEVARDLLGCVVATNVDGIIAAGRIVEAEAYLGIDDAGSHASTKGVTKRNAVMYGPAGSTYVYFTYGNHYMLNLVTEPQGVAGAVLIRALEPLLGIDAMTSRRRGWPLRELCNGPGKLTAALGIDLTDNDRALGAGRISLYDRQAPPGDVALSGRIGLSAGHELDLRFYLEGNEFVSRGRIGPVRSRH